jgi:hypothetical protein
MANQAIPKNIRSLLTENETIEKRFDLKGCKLYATDKRLLRTEGRSITDFDYAHISSIMYSSKRYWWLIVPGIVLMIIGAFVGSYAGIALIIIGFIFIIAGAIAKSEWVEANVVGVPKPVKFEGSRQDLDSLLQIVRQKRIVKPTVGKIETKVVDIAETIRKLAELRDEGIITQEEFEEKKSKLLRNSN